MFLPIIANITFVIILHYCSSIWITDIYWFGYLTHRRATDGTRESFPILCLRPNLTQICPFSRRDCAKRKVKNLMTSHGSRDCVETMCICSIMSDFTNAQCWSYRRMTIGIARHHEVYYSIVRVVSSPKDGRETDFCGCISTAGIRMKNNSRTLMTRFSSHRDDLGKSA